jgi:hypothetical protein
MPAPSLAEVLKSSGWTQEQIDALDAKAQSGLTNYVSNVYQTAEQKQQEAATLAAKAEADRKIAVESSEAARVAQEKAELESRSTKEFWDNTYSPGVAAWETERQKLLQDKINADAHSAFLKAQNDGAKAAGFIPADAPAYTPTTTTTTTTNGTRDGQGRFVAGQQGGTPGSPTFTVDDVRSGFGTMLGTIPDIQWRHQALYGKPMPIAPTELVKQAEALKLSPGEYAARTFKFSERQQELDNQAKEAEKQKIIEEAQAPMKAQIEAEKAAAAKAVADNDKKWAEKIGNNPDVRIAQPSRFADVTRAVKAGERPDPTKMNEAARRKATHQAIMSEISEAHQVA